MIPPVLPRFHFSPRLGGEETVHFRGRQNSGPARLAITVPVMGDSSQQPHRVEWNRSPKCIARFRDETASAGSKHAVHFRDGAMTIGQHRKKTRCYQDVETAVRVREFQDVGIFKTTVFQAQFRHFLSSPVNLARRTINSHHGNFRESLGQPARIKSGTAS